VTRGRVCNLFVQFTVTPGPESCRTYDHTLLSRFRLPQPGWPDPHNKVENKEQCHVEISNRFPALVYLDHEVDINGAWEAIRNNIQISAKRRLCYFELKKLKFVQNY
jgi:hypothetical protein